jgi:hypothetical protein
MLLLKKTLIKASPPAVATLDSDGENTASFMEP